MTRRPVRESGRALSLRGRCPVCGSVLRMLVRPERLVLVCDDEACNRLSDAEVSALLVGAA